MMEVQSSFCEGREPQACLTGVVSSRCWFYGDSGKQFSILKVSGNFEFWREKVQLAAGGVDNETQITQLERPCSVGLLFASRSRILCVVRWLRDLGSTRETSLGDLTM
jgi:hypothetical protein